jgi:hypothetical protein
MEKIIKNLLGLTTDNRKVYDFKPGYRTTNVKETLTFEQWCKEYRVSMAHGKSAVHFG